MVLPAATVCVALPTPCLVSVATPVAGVTELELATMLLEDLSELEDMGVTSFEPGAGRVGPAYA